MRAPIEWFNNQYSRHFSPYVGMRFSCAVSEVLLAAGHSDVHDQNIIELVTGVLIRFILWILRDWGWTITRLRLLYWMHFHSTANPHTRTTLIHRGVMFWCFPSLDEQAQMQHSNRPGSQRCRKQLTIYICIYVFFNFSLAYFSKYWDHH